MEMVTLLRPLSDPYPLVVNSSEVDLRQEMTNTIHGSYPEIAKGQKLLIRKMRKDAYGHKIACQCVDKVSGMPDLDDFCPVCYGEGYLWDEDFGFAYSRVILGGSTAGTVDKDFLDPGTQRVPSVVFYFE